MQPSKYVKIALIGPMASGKTTLGQKLAETLHYPFCDTDQWIEAETGMNISDIFATKGEPFFRAYETKALQHFLIDTPSNMVLSTGGGIVKPPENRLLLLHHSRVVYLDVSVATQLKRTEGDTTRPLLTTPDKAAVLTKLKVERTPWYVETAHITLNVDHDDPEALINILQNSADAF